MIKPHRHTIKNYTCELIPMVVRSGGVVMPRCLHCNKRVSVSSKILSLHADHAPDCPGWIERNRGVAEDFEILRQTGKTHIKISGYRHTDEYSYLFGFQDFINGEYERVARITASNTMVCLQGVRTTGIDFPGSSVECLGPTRVYQEIFDKEYNRDDFSLDTDIVISK